MIVKSIGVVKSQQAEAALRRMKQLTKKEIITFNDIISRTSAAITDKKIYMQRRAFLEDPHNKIMFELADRLMTIRDCIAKNIAEHNINSKNRYKQAINGYTRKESDLAQNNDFEFIQQPMLSQDTMLDNQYHAIKNLISKQ